MEELKTIKKEKKTSIITNSNTYSQVSTYINFDDFDTVEEVKVENTNSSNNNNQKKENQYTKDNIESITGIYIKKNN